MKLINLPNIITSCNLLCGCFAIVAGLNGLVGMACVLIILGAAFDFFDGMTARALHISGPIGKELDSLADCVTFGVAPAVLCYHILGTFIADLGGVDSITDNFPSIAFLMAAFSALRLAKFNCDERQSLSFIGMPTPANALLWIGMIYLNQVPAIHDIPYMGLIILGLMLLCCYLLICELPMFSLKIKPGHMAWAENKVRYTFLVLCVCIIIASAVMGCLMASFAPIIILYIVFSILDNVKH